jgi:thioesterase domain-containing protein
VHDISGSHFTMMSEPGISEVVQVLRPILDTWNACEAEDQPGSTASVGAA